jgi:hypothetical protein
LADPSDSEQAKQKAKSLEVTMERAYRYDLADPSDSEQAKQKAKSLEVTVGF